MLRSDCKSGRRHLMASCGFIGGATVFDAHPSDGGTSEQEVTRYSGYTGCEIVLVTASSCNLGRPWHACAIFILRSDWGC